jgi:hypothetical protein
MNITINGKITNALPPRRGTSKVGNEWVSQDFVIEIENEEKICFNVFGEDKIKESGLRVGAVASVTCKVESKEWNGKWFTSVSCVNCIVQGSTQPTHAQPKPQPQVADFGNNTNNAPSVDSLPF